MTRKIDDTAIKTPDLQIKAQISDTYVRPTVAPESDLEQLAQSLVSVQPSLAKYLHTKQEEKDDFEIAQGIQMWDDYAASHKNFSEDEVYKKIQAGDLDGFRKLTRMQKQGIYQARHRMLGLNLQTHLATWAEGATLEDENGNAVPLAQVKNQERVMSAFMQEKARWVKEVTGGKFDPILYQQYVANAENSAINTFIQKQAAARVEQLHNEQIRTATGILDGLVMPYIQNGSLIANPDTAVVQLTETLNMEAVAMAQRGINETDAMEIMSQYLQATLKIVPVDNIEPLLAMAKGLPLWENPEIRKTLTDTGENAERAAYFKAERDKQARQDKAEAAIFDLLKPSLTGGPVDKAAVEALASENFVAYQAYLDVSKAISLGYENNIAMDEGEFNNLRLQLLRGEIGYQGALKYAGSMNKRQIDDLLQIADHNEQKIRQAMADRRAEDRAAASQSALKKPWDAIQKEVAKYYKASDLQKVAGSSERVHNIDEVNQHIIEETYWEFEAWKEANPKASIAMQNKMRSEITYKTFSKYEKNISTYEADPDKMRDDPKEVRVKEATASIRHGLSLIPKQYQSQYEEAINAKDPKKLETLFKKYAPRQDKNGRPIDTLSLTRQVIRAATDLEETGGGSK